MTDEYAMLAVASGKTNQAAVLYERHKRTAMAYFYKQGLSRDNAQDLTHQVFYRLIKYAKSFREEAPFKPWLYTLMHHVHMDFLKENPLMYYDLTDIQEQLADHTAEDFSHETRLLNSALAKLPDEFKTVIILAKFEELKYEEISKILNISVALVKVRMHRGLKALKEKYLELNENLS